MREDNVPPSFFRERRLLKLGPVVLVRSAWSYVIVGWLLAAATLVMLLRSEALFASEAAAEMGIWQNTLLLKFLAIAIGLLFTFRLKFPGKPGFFVSTVLYALVPCAAFVMVECLNGNAAYDRAPEIIFMNLLAYAVVYLLFLVVFGNYRWSVFVGTALFYAFALACHFVLSFRGTPFVPLDIISTGTAANVIANYVFALTPQWTAATIQAGLILGVGFLLGRGSLRRVRWKLTLRALAALLIIGTVGTFFSQSYLQERSYVVTYWQQHLSYEQFGNWFAFCINLRGLVPEPPESYDAKNVSAIAEELLPGDDTHSMLSGANDYETASAQPNIIVIMNESLSDLQSKGKGFDTNEPVLEFFNSLKENTVRGDLQVSVAGGSTACTEYEVLTGNAQRFLPNGAVAFSSNIHASTPSFIWTLREQGYQTAAFHPYRASGWNRERAYAYLGIEESTFIDDIVPQEMTFDAAWSEAAEAIDPNDGDVLNRLFMSDHYDFKIVRELYEARDKDKPFFLFNVTMQNHGSYDAAYPNFEEGVQITDMDGDYPWTERYLSLIQATDVAFEELISYFRDDVDEPTIIVMFGDHIPSVEQEFYDELYGMSINALSVDDAMERYRTPFVIWANYDIPEKNVGTISANYLSTLVLETAGVQLSDYERYLASFSAEVPVISSLGFIDAEGHAVEDSRDTSYATLIDGYECLAYNNLLDSANRDWSLFTLDGQPLPDVSVADDDS